MIYQVDDVTFDSSLYSVQRGGKSFRLRPKVFRVCLYLLEHRERVVSRQELCTQVWGGRFVSQATLEGVIRSVREALGDSGRTQRIIQTCRGYGYRFVADVEERAPRDAGEEATPPETLSRSHGSDMLVRSARLAIGVEAAQGWKATHSSGRSDEGNPWQPEAPGQAVDRPSASVPGGQYASHGRSSGSPWRISGGRRLTVVALVLLSALGLWWGINRKMMEPLEEARIAVLPFIDLSTMANQASLADGIQDELIAQLSQIPGLAVIPRTSVLQYKGSLKDIATIGREVGVGAIVEGSIRNLDKQVRVSVQLIDVASQGHLWSHDYTRKSAGAAITQSDIATHLAQGLRVQLTAQSIYNRSEGEPRLTTLVQRTGHGK